jgi:hypothetical protein
MGISSGWRALRRRPATVEASGVLFATVERECTEALPFVRMQRLGDSWTDELRADRIAQVVDYLRKSFGHSAPIPATITLWAQSTCGRETTDQRLRNSTSKYGRRFLSTRQQPRPSAWLGLLLSVWEAKSWQSSIGEREQLRNMLSQEQTLAPSFCSMLHHYCPRVHSR